MHSASPFPRPARRQPAQAVPCGFTEKRSGYSDNSTPRTVHLGDVKTTTEHPTAIAPLGPRSRTFAPCGVLFPPLDKYATVALAPTRANVAYTSAIPPVVGTSGRFHGVLGGGNSSRLRHSLFCLSDFFPTTHGSHKNAPHRPVWGQLPAGPGSKTIPKAGPTHTRAKSAI